MSDINIDDVINERDGWKRMGPGIYARARPPVDPLPVRFKDVSDDDPSEFGVIKEVDNGTD